MIGRLLRLDLRVVWRSRQSCADRVWIAAAGDKGEEEEEEQCAVCRMELEPEEEVVSLPCKHLYHGECISQWLKDRKVGVAREASSVDRACRDCCCCRMLLPLPFLHVCKGRHRVVFT